MPIFAANLSMLFTEVPFMQRFEAATRAGFDAVEYLFPYSYDVRELSAALRANGLRQVLHNLPAGDWEAGERGIACHPARIAEFRAGVEQAIRFAEILECPQLNCLAGRLPKEVEMKKARETLVNNLRFASSALHDAGIRLLLEPVNDIDVPGFFVNRTDIALSIMDEVSDDNLRLQYDIYHAQQMEGELGTTLEKHIKRIGHIQIADNPGRNEPGTGEIRYDWLLPHIDRLGYAGWIGCEYIPRDTTESGLGWLTTYRPQDIY